VWYGVKVFADVHVDDVPALHTKASNSPGSLLRL
jgi:hypothetical protein